MMKDLAQIAQVMRGRNPQEIAMNMLRNTPISNDPTITQLVGFAQKGDMNSLVNLASSIFAQQGMNFNEEFQSFMSMLK